MSRADTKNSSGVTPGIIACVMAVAGIFIWGILFVPLALLFLCFGFIFAILGGSGAGIGYNALGLVLTIIAVLTSPALLGLIGLGALAGNL